MNLGMISCNYFMKIYDYNKPEDFSWPEMVEKYHREFTRDDLSALIDEVKNIGFNSIEIWEPHASYRLLDREDAKKIKELCLAKGVTPTAYCIGGWRPEDIEVIERGYEFAAGLGVKVIVGVLPAENNEEILNKLDQYGEKYGIRYAIENHPAPAFENPKDINEVLKKHSEYIGANVDVGIYYQTGYDVMEAVKLFGDRIYHIHFKEATDDGNKAAPGTGDAPLKILADYLVENNYQYMVSIEHETPYDPTEDLKKAYEIFNYLEKA